MWVVGIVVMDPLVEPDFKLKRIIPVIWLHDIFFDRLHDALGIGVALGIRPGLQP